MSENPPVKERLSHELGFNTEITTVGSDGVAAFPLHQLDSDETENDEGW